MHSDLSQALSLIDEDVDHLDKSDTMQILQQHCIVGLQKFEQLLWVLPCEWAGCV